MQLIQKIFGKKKDIPLSPEKKLSMLDDQPSTLLEAIANGENDDFNELTLRLAATKKLPYSQALCHLAFEDDSHSEINRVARLRIAHHLDAKAISSETLLEDINDAEQILSIASLTASDDLQQQVLAGIESEDILGKICMESSSAAVRYSLAERIERQDILREISERLKNKDKKAYKLVKSKLDLFKTQEKSLKEKRSKIDALYEEVERHVSRHVDHQYKLEVDRLKRRWDESSEDATADQKTKILKALNQCEAELERVKDSLAEKEREIALKRETEKKYTALVEIVQKNIADIVSFDSWSEELALKQKQTLENLQSEWNQLGDIEQAKPSVKSSFDKSVSIAEKLVAEYAVSGTLAEQVNRLESFTASQDQENHSADEDKSGINVDDKPTSNKFRSYYQNIKKTVKLFDSSHTSLPQVAVAQKAIDNYDRTVSAELEEQKRQLGAIGGLIRKSSGAVEQGRLKQAIGIRHSITKKLQGLGQTVPEYLQKKIDILDEDIQKLIDWQAYAVTPKKEALIESMTKLVGADLLPEALAAKIKKLQEEWRELKQNGLDKSGQDKNDVLWESFKKQADLAYEPCREYFLVLSNTRKENLDKRKALVAQLEDFDSQYDWENADWKTVEKVIRTARNELHSYVPVDRSDNKVVLEEFDKMMDQIQSKLNAEREKNKVAKEQLIVQAEKLSEISEIQQAIDAAKRLQSQWKKIGPCHYRDSEALWKSFRTACDLVFERKSKEDDVQRSQDSEKISEANALIARLKSLSEKLPDQLSVVNSEKQTIYDAFYALEDIPEKAHRALQREYSKANEQIEKEIQVTLRKNEEQSWLGLFNVIRLSNTYRFTLQSNPSDAEILLSDLNSSLDSLTIWPEGTQSLVRSCIAESDSLQESKRDTNSAIDQLKTLCIRAEIAADKPSPSEDKNLRMEYQVGMLQKGLGRASNENSRSMLIRDWIKSSAVPKDQYDSLFDRFKTSWNVLS